MASAVASEVAPLAATEKLLAKPSGANGVASKEAPLATTEMVLAKPSGSPVVVSKEAPLATTEMVLAKPSGAPVVVSKEAPLATTEKLLAKPSGVPGVAYYMSNPMSLADARRLFNSGGFPFGLFDKEGEDETGDSKDDVLANDHRRKSDLTSADLVDPFGASKNLGKLLSKIGGAASSLAGPRRGWWVSKEDDDAMTLKVPMPGLEKEHVKVRADKNVVVIKGEREKDAEDDKEEMLRYSHRIEFPADGFKMDRLRAEMKSGLLKVTVPKLKEEERKDVFYVTVE